MILCSCNVAGKADYTYLQSYVIAYLEGPLQVGIVTTNQSVRIDVGVRGGMRYSAPEVGREDESTEKFLEIATRNGDRSYNRREAFESYYNRECFAENFKAVHVTCLNVDWDPEHLRGVLLNDIAKINYCSYAEYIQSGYAMGAGGRYDIKQLEDLTEGDLTMINTRLQILFDKLPVAGSYEIKITMITTENMEKVATCTFVVE